MVIGMIVSCRVTTRDTEYWQGFFKFVKECGVVQANNQQKLAKFAIYREMDGVPGGSFLLC